jgi:hypothetical protein
MCLVSADTLVPAAPEDTIPITGYPEGSWINYSSWSPDGTYISFTTRSPGGTQVLGLMQLRGSADAAAAWTRLHRKHWAVVGVIVHAVQSTTSVGADVHLAAALVASEQHGNRSRNMGMVDVCDCRGTWRPCPRPDAALDCRHCNWQGTATARLSASEYRVR